jgi:hypothetical protein
MPGQQDFKVKAYGTVTPPPPPEDDNDEVVEETE